MDTQHAQTINMSNQSKLSFSTKNIRVAKANTFEA